MNLSIETAKTILDNAPLPVICWNGDNELTYFNSNAKEFFELSENHLGDDIELLFNGYKTNIFEKIISNEVITLQLRGVQRHFKFYTYKTSENLTVAQAVDASQSSYEVQAFDEQRCQAIHEHKMDMISQLAAGLSHEVNNPLGIISLSASILEERIDSLSDVLGEDSEKVLNYIENIDCAIDRTREIIQKLLIFSRKQKEDRIEEFNVETFIRNSLVFCKINIKNKGIKIEEDFDRDINIKTMNSTLMQCFVYLLYNAVEAFHEQEIENPKIVISAKKENKDLILSISNNGMPLIESDQEKMFSPFYSTKGPGHLGIGLTQCRTLLKTLKGDIQFNRHDNISTFEIRIPSELS
ncbi:HAMP domain-containing sensor histidine kinase [Halobacteriovorax sp. GB3]|uniref:sensor histidine kinase n=1 Tax=Halobacteriovorax sp. GB3 TaxID=2719615 RepID=UPI0023609B99|nr:HAMP domain-containing sensor histidine kinase [Halobacteriovorax sp. GB3]MDD0853689.1 HAMP domain-containing sensor histidine kinase [Halobacteriovorax sp. GB3]